MDIQLLEYEADVRIKFASINEKGGLTGDAHQAEYNNFFKGFISGWSYEKLDFMIETRSDYQRRAWVMKHATSGTKVAAVEHETGIEIVFDTGKELAIAAIIALIKWSWKKWSKVRASSRNKVEPSLIIERVTERRRNGKIRTVQRFETRGPIDAKILKKSIEQIITGHVCKKEMHS